MIYYNPQTDISLSEAAKRLDVTPQDMSFLVKKKTFKTARRIGWHVFIDIKEINAYIPNKGGRPRKQRKP